MGRTCGFPFTYTTLDDVRQVPEALEKFPELMVHEEQTA